MCSNMKTMILGDAKLETALSISRTCDLFNGASNDLVHFLKAEVDELILRKKQLRAVATRSNRVSSVSSQSGSSGGSWGRGHGGQGRGNRMPRTYLTRIVEGKDVNNGNYSRADFANLTNKEKEAV